MIITKHAAQRYIDRVRPEADLREAHVVLRDAATRCKKVDRTWRGQVVWAVDNPSMRLVTKHDPECGAVCVTVLGPDEPLDDEPSRAMRPPPPLVEDHRALVAYAQRETRKARSGEVSTALPLPKTDRPEPPPRRMGLTVVQMPDRTLVPVAPPYELSPALPRRTVAATRLAEKVAADARRAERRALHEQRVRVTSACAGEKLAQRLAHEAHVQLEAAAKVARTEAPAKTSAQHAVVRALGVTTVRCPVCCLKGTVQDPDSAWGTESLGVRLGACAACVAALDRDYADLSAAAAGCTSFGQSISTSALVNTACGTTGAPTQVCTV